jgi:transposase-like protein
MNQGRTVFSQLIAFLPDREFRRCVARYDVLGDDHDDGRLLAALSQRRQQPALPVRLADSQMLPSPASTSSVSWLRQAKEESGGIGALLRREGLYSSHLVTWRHEHAAGILHALTPQKRGPKSKRSPLDEENQKLRRENQHLSEELRKAEIVIDIQKTWPLFWGVRSARRTGSRNFDGGRRRVVPGGRHASRL